MASYSLSDAVVDLLDLASTVIILVSLICCLRALLETQRNSCRACQPPEVRAVLLLAAFTIPMAWMAAAGSYIRILSLLWELMGLVISDQPVNRPLYASLHLYLFFLLVGGTYAVSITISEASRNCRVFSDLWRIARFRAERHEAIEDVEAQHSPSSLDPITPEAEILFDVGNAFNTSSPPLNGGLHETGQASNDGVAPAETHIEGPEHPVGNAAWSLAHYTVGERTLNSAMIQTPCSSSCDSSASSSTSDDSEYVDTDNDQRGPPEQTRRAPPKDRNSKRRPNTDSTSHIRDFRSLQYEPLSSSDHEDLSSSSCESCSSAHAKTIPTVTPSLVRVPISPTSPTVGEGEGEWPVAATSTTTTTTFTTLYRATSATSSSSTSSSAAAAAALSNLPAHHESTSDPTTTQSPFPSTSPIQLQPLETPRLSSPPRAPASTAAAEAGADENTPQIAVPRPRHEYELS